MKYAKLDLNKVVQVQPNSEDGFVRVSDNVVCGMIEEDGEYVAHRNTILLNGVYIQDVAQETIDTTNDLIANFKSLYLGIVDAKLKDKDYDSLATVKLWEDDDTFGDEATQILTWYKAIIVKNYEILNSGVVPTEEEYLAEINAIEF